MEVGFFLLTVLITSCRVEGRLHMRTESVAGWLVIRKRR